MNIVLGCCGRDEGLVVSGGWGWRRCWLMVVGLPVQGLLLSCEMVICMLVAAVAEGAVWVAWWWGLVVGLRRRVGDIVGGGWGVAVGCVRCWRGSPPQVVGRCCGCCPWCVLVGVGGVLGRPMAVVAGIAAAEGVVGLVGLLVLVCRGWGVAGVGVKRCCSVGDWRGVVAVLAAVIAGGVEVSGMDGFDLNCFWDVVSGARVRGG